MFPKEHLHGKLFCRITLSALTLFFMISEGISIAASPSLLSNPDKLRFDPLSFTPPGADRFKLDNGLVVHLVEDRELPLVEITALVRTGHFYDPRGKEGLAELTGAVMASGGISGMSGNAVTEALESIAAPLHTSINRDSGLFTLSLLKKDLDLGLDIFSRILMKPVFEQEKLDLEKALKLEELRRVFDDPQKLAFREFGRLMYESDSRGGLASPDSINGIQREDLIRFHGQCYHPDRVMLSISGDIDRGEAETAMKRHFGAWKPSEGRLDLPDPPHPQQGKIFFLPKELPQSVIIFGWLAPPKTVPPFFPFKILDHIVGSGGFRSRIFQEIRTQRGLAYSAGSFYTAKDRYGLFSAYAITKSESTLSVLSLIRDIIRDISQNPIPSEELKRAKAAIENSFIFSFTASEQIAFQQMMLEYEHLPDDYLARYRDLIQKVTQADINNVAAQYLGPEGALILIVGSEKTCQAVSTLDDTVIRIDSARD
jgi:predicted Zn-dependent peptidase